MPHNPVLARYQRKSTGGGFFKTLFILLLFGAVAATAYWGYYNQERLSYYFKADKHAELRKRVASVGAIIAKSNNSKNEAVEAVRELLEGLVEDQAGDGFIFFMRGEFFNTIFEAGIENSDDFYRDLFFNAYLERYDFPAKLDHENWQSALLAYRKALVLHLSDEDRKQATLQLVSLSLWGGQPYWESAQGLSKKGVSAHLFNIILTESEPKWKLLRKNFDSTLVDFWRGLYQLKTGNEPLAFSILKDITLVELTEEAPALEKKSLHRIKNNALYLLGHVMGKQKKKRSQLKFYQEIGLKDFLNRAPWFLKEYHFLLRFLGRQQEATALLSKYEKSVNGA